MKSSQLVIAMTELAGLGIAVGNAPEDIKKVANFVTDTNMNDGITKVVTRLNP